MSAARILDAAGIGAGPFNLGFAALAGSVPGLDVQVFEAAEGIDWHPGMMLEGTHLQVPFMADLVTMADPTHPLSFLAFLKDTGRLYPFYIREDFYPLRAEYNRYLRWAASRLPAVRFGHRVAGCSHDGASYVLELATADGPRSIRARSLVLGTGTQPHVPSVVSPAALASGAAFHTSEYRARRRGLASARRIAVVGSGQSAAEVFAELLAGLGPGQELAWVTRSERFFPLEYTKLTLEMTSPEYIDHFHGLPQGTRDRLAAGQKGLFKGINAELVNHIHELLYQRSVDGAAGVRLMASTALESLEPGPGGLRLALRNQDDGGAHALGADAAVLATGYSYREPEFLAGIGERIRRLPDGRLDVDRGYSAGVHGDVLVQNAELHTHGFTAPDLGMGAYRNSVILNRLAGREHFAVERRIAFQEFGTPVDAAPDPLESLDFDLQEATR
ncbi:lysine N(6)-hydroxylase/L-ornithine N(5)-oxygenase family protein [Zafaria sp. J156]|uniref:lysine N(6)-hydroxylase/L-ornithine N(5)-oxygenase family protein n=1 Tax=Zafaria sp. J156 TaxID=3116490 RepID=UPI002E75BACE|nr:SidA/IucD/PvdA family monooxygenase [Zafaria sp. J156]MEE1621294.1 SidA/IucD/PvdA family monooxygenase [Zafaria sp. J156]